MAKQTKTEAGYVDNAQHASRYDCDDQCSNCAHYLERDRDSTCAEVMGTINAMGWCRWYTELKKD